MKIKMMTMTTTSVRQSSSTRTNNYLYFCIIFYNIYILVILSILDCEECGTYFYNKCEIHGPALFIPDTPVQIGLEGRARQTLPSRLKIQTSNIPDAGLGVFNMGETVPIGAHFGPYQGELVARQEAMNSRYSWVVSEICFLFIWWMNVRNEDDFCVCRSAGAASVKNMWMLQKKPLLTGWGEECITLKCDSGYRYKWISWVLIF